MTKLNKRKQKSNYLDFIPAHAQNCRFTADEEGKVTLFIENKGMFHWIAQKFFGKPRVTQVHLDEMGNFVWPLIDGKRTVYDIALVVKNAFGEKAEPLYGRLISYMRTLESYGFVTMK